MHYEAVHHFVLPTPDAIFIGCNIMACKIKTTPIVRFIAAAISFEIKLLGLIWLCGATLRRAAAGSHKVSMVMLQNSLPQHNKVQ